jgi:hypothetical protein
MPPALCSPESRRGGNLSLTHMFFDPAEAFIAHRLLGFSELA